jgi:hypothetical protein
MKTEIARAIDLIKGSRYIRLITPNGITRISHKVAISAVYDTARCLDCIGTEFTCSDCIGRDSRLEIRGRSIHLDGVYGRPGIITL